MATYQAATYELHHPQVQQHEAAQRFDAQATDLNLYPIVEGDQVALSPENSTWDVTVGSTEAVMTRPAPRGLLIRDTDRSSGHTSYAYIDSEGNRRFLNTDDGTYPIEVAGRLMEVRDHRQANRLGYNDPLGLAIPEAYQPYWNGDYGDYTGRHVNTAKGPSLGERFRNTRFGKMVVGLLTRSSAQPAEQSQPPEAPAAFQPIVVAGEPLPRRTGTPTAAQTAPTETEPTAAAAGASRLTRVAEGLGLVTSAIQTKERAPAHAREEGLHRAPDMTPAERQKLTLEAVLFDISQALGMNSDRLPSIDTLRVRGDVPAAIQTVLTNYRRRAENGDAGAVSQMTALIEFMPLVSRK
jgi:hypothetical protein